MSKKASPTAIGAFVVGAAALAVAGVIVFGSGRLFQKTYPFVAYFEGSVNGLSLGAPVKFKGVDIGQVTHIFIQVDPKDQNARIPVYFVLDDEKLKRAGARDAIQPDMIVERAVQYGLRAQLQTESLVTGVLFVELNYHPDTQATLVGSWDGTPEIPTLPTQIEQAQSAVKQVIQKLDEINFKGLIDQLTDAAKSITDFAKSEELKQTISSLDQTLASVRELSDTVKKSVDPLTDTLRNAGERVEAVGRELEMTLSSTRELIEPGAPLAVDLRRALSEVQDAAAAVHSLADELDRNPSAVVFGRQTEESR